MDSSATGGQLRQAFHTTEEFAPESGVTGMIQQLTRYLAGQGLATTILTAEGRVSLVPSDVNLIKFPLALGGFWRFPRGLKSYLQQLPRSRGHILHLHGVWMGFQWVAARVALAQKVPVVL